MKPSQNKIEAVFYLVTASGLQHIKLQLSAILENAIDLTNH